MRKPIVLCVDDEKIVLNSLKEQLKRGFGTECRIETSEGGEDALEIFEELIQNKDEIPVVISDYIMPDIKGDELLKRIHAIAPKTRKIMLTGQASLEGVTHAVNQANLYRYISKPWEYDDLILTIKQAIHTYELDKQVEEQNRELRKHRDQLEELVKERTTELIAANEQLRSEIAERARIEEELIRAKEIAEMANVAKSQFLSSMSHELRTPLNGILGYAQILRRSKDLTTIQKDGLDIIYQSGNHLLTLINDILDLSRIEAGKMELYPSDIHLTSFLETIVGIAKMRAQQKNIRFSYEALTHLPAGIRADEKRLRQILLNLLSNAVKFTEQGCVSFKVSSTCTGKCTSEHIAQIQFDIEDTGIGMTTEQMNKIFRPFEQVSDAKYRIEGTGLGLAISRQIAELMKGSIQVESQIGKGSTFRLSINLPVIHFKDKTISAAPVSMITGYKGKPLNVMVADDRSDNRMLLLNMLAPLGFEVMIAVDGQEAVEKCRQCKPDLILMDLVMPVKTGFEAVQEIRQMPDMQQVPIIAVSASVFDMDQQKSRIMGCDTFLPKPIDETQLFTTLEKLLNLEWIYDDNQQLMADSKSDKVLSENDMIPPPEDILKELYRIAEYGNMDRIQQLAGNIEKMDNAYIPFSRKLSEMAKQFEDEQILVLIKQFLEIKA